MEDKGVTIPQVMVGIAVVFMVLTGLVVYKAYFAPPPPAEMVKTFTAVKIYVLNSITRNPVANASVNITGVGAGTTDSSGTLTLSYVPAGDYETTVTCENYYTTRTRLSLRGYEQVLVRSVEIRPASVGATLSTIGNILDNVDNRTVLVGFTLSIPEKTMMLGAVADLKVDPSSTLSVLSISATGLTKVEENHWRIALGTLTASSTTSISVKVDSQDKPVGSQLVLNLTVKDTPDVPDLDNNLIPDLTGSMVIRVVAA